MRTVGNPPNPFESEHREDEELPSPGWFHEGPSQQRGRLALDDDLRVEIRAGPEAPILMGGPGITIRTGVKAAAVWIEAPTKRKVRTFIVAEDVAGLVLQHSESDLRRGFQKFSVLRFERVRRIGRRLHAGYRDLPSGPCQVAPSPFLSGRLLRFLTSSPVPLARPFIDCIRV